MKKIVLVYALLIVAFVLLAVFGFGRQIPFLPNLGGNDGIVATTANAKIGDKEIDLIIAKSEEERIKGLSGRDSLAENEGMLFIFEEKGEYGFWMKEMKFPIDIIFIEDETVVNVAKNAAPAVDANLTIYEPEQPINRVLELNAGKADELGITSGSKISFDGI